MQVTFREVFLRSTAVELLVDNLLRTPPVDAEEEVLVTELLSCTLVGGTPTATHVLRRVVGASRALQGYVPPAHAVPSTRSHRIQIRGPCPSTYLPQGERPLRSTPCCLSSGEGRMGHPQQDRETRAFGSHSLRRFPLQPMGADTRPSWEEASQSPTYTRSVSL